MEEALSQKPKVSFVYFDRNENGERVYLKERERYIVESMALIFNEDNYYLMCYSPKYDNIINYHMDRKDEVMVEKESVSEPMIIPDEPKAEYVKEGQNK